jgi:hypothetical protein
MYRNKNWLTGRLRFDREAMLFAILVFIIEVLVATAWSQYRWLRDFGGDVLAVVWLYWVFKTVVQASAQWLAGAAFLTGCLVELGQYAASFNHWHIDNRVLRIVLGSVADSNDILAYAVGAAGLLLGAAIRGKLRGVESNK